jgi:hypothetical protein
MILYQDIHVNHYEMNENGIVISYTFKNVLYHLVIAAEDALDRLETVGGHDTLSQYDAIQLVYYHEQEKEIKENTQRFMETGDLFQMLNGINRAYALAHGIKL